MKSIYEVEMLNLKPSDRPKMMWKKMIEIWECCILVRKMLWFM